MFRKCKSIQIKSRLSAAFVRGYEQGSTVDGMRDFFEVTEIVRNRIGMVVVQLYIFTQMG